MKNLILGILIFTLSWQIQARLFDHQWVVNSDHSELHFQIPFLKVSQVSGRFDKMRGTVHFDEDLILPKDIFLSFYSQSINTGNSMRDGHLRSKDFLDSATYKAIIFQSSEIKALEPDEFMANGRLIIKGTGYPFSVQFRLTSEAINDSWGNPNKFATFKGTLDREKYKIEWNKNISDGQFLIGNEINFHGTIQLQPAKSITPSQRFMIPNTRYMQEREKLMRKEITPQQFQKFLEEIESKAEQEITEFNNPSEIDEKEANLTATKIENISDNNSEMTRTPKERDFYWWLSFGLTAFFSMVGLILAFIYCKSFLSDYLGEKYQENGLYGNLIDLIVYPIGGLLLIALWYLYTFY